MSSICGCQETTAGIIHRMECPWNTRTAATLPAIPAGPMPVIDVCAEAKARADRAERRAKAWSASARLWRREAAAQEDFFSQAVKGWGEDQHRVTDLEQAVVVLVEAAIGQNVINGEPWRWCRLCRNGLGRTNEHQSDCALADPAVRRVLGEEENDATSNAC